MCRAWERGTCQFGDSCKFSHDWKAIWQAREPDLGKLLNMKCPVFEKYGFCHYGLVCRFAECHVRINDDGTYTNEKRPDWKLQTAFESNRINPGWQTMLRDSRFSFPRTRKSMEAVSSYTFFSIVKLSLGKMNYPKKLRFLENMVRVISINLSKREGKVFTKKSQTNFILMNRKIQKKLEASQMAKRKRLISEEKLIWHRLLL